MGHQTAGRVGGPGPISKLHNNKLQSLGTEWSMSNVVMPPPNNSDKPHGLVASDNNNKNVRVGWCFGVTFEEPLVQIL